MSSKVNGFDPEQLLQDKRVIAEIERHLWIESEKAGHDIGFEKAKEDWLKNFSRAWMAYHMPQALKLSPKSSRAKSASSGSKKSSSSGKIRRRAKSYFSGSS